MANANEVAVGKGLDEYCVPFVSEYTDCTEENKCSGCSKCTCSGEGKWICDNVSECADAEEDLDDVDDNDIDRALYILQEELKQKETKEILESTDPLVPAPNKDDDLLLEAKEYNMEDEIIALMRSKRSVDETKLADKENDTVKFYHAVDELNEDTLKNKNGSGTLTVQKVDALPKISRRTSLLNSTSNSLQIEYTQTKEHNHHDDNKVDTPAIHDDKVDLFIHSNLYNDMSNYSQVDKDKDLSKIVVNELNGGEETIGGKNAPVISNITFTPENDTIIAMAFIAGNLLNKLWNMEKDTNEDALDTEALKREKIADLLELFKEPLNVRQETFLKNALDQLSIALNQNKNVENISLCKNIKDSKKLFVDAKEADTKINNNDSKENTNYGKNKQTKKNESTARALDKINNVLDLIKKYDNVQNNLKDIKSAHLYIKSDRRISDESITKDEKQSLDMYGKTLETITKLLIPTKKNKKVINSLQNSNMFASRNDLKKKLSNIQLENLNVTTKDRIVLDYLAHIQRNPECLLKKQRDTVSMPSIEGNILLNLSEFFKIMSLSDLMKLVETEKPTLRVRDMVTTLKPVTQPTTESLNIVTVRSKQFKNTKEKLKSHLKSILEDLIELQKGEGKSTQNIQIMDALPCIYNLMNAGKEEYGTKKNKTDHVSNISIPSKNIQAIFDNLKNELKIAKTRRVNVGNGPRPKSAVVWERMMKNAEGKQKLKTRRNIRESLKTLEELKNMIDKIDATGSNTYKNYAYLNEVPPAERLMLLKTFNADTVNYMKALEKINLSLYSKPNIPEETLKEFNEFIDNVASNVNLNEKVVKNLDKPKKTSNPTFTIDPKRQMRYRAEVKLEKPLAESTSYGMKLSKEEIINQLLRNRILLYVQTKEATKETDDMNYNIAKKILLHLNLGNLELATELYKVFVSLKQKESTNLEKMNTGLERELNLNKQIPWRRPAAAQIEPLIKFEDPKTIHESQVLNQDHFIKQLLNLGKMKVK